MAAFTSIMAGVGAASALAGTGMQAASAAAGQPNAPSQVPGGENHMGQMGQGFQPSFAGEGQQQSKPPFSPFGGLPGGGGWMGGM